MNSAVQRAVGAYGWWKTRKRTVSLTQLLKSQKAAISLPMTFNRTTYTQKWGEGGVWGAAVQDGKLSVLSLPNASTATESGMICLCALVAALLCFFGDHAITQILVHVVSWTMIHYVLEGDEVAVEGPLIAAFNQYVQAVAVEADCDTLWTKLLDLVNIHQAQITGTSLADILKLDAVYTVDSHLIISLVQWVLTLMKLQHWYPTQSLHLWALGLVLSQLGFEVDVEYRAVASEDDYAFSSTSSNQFAGHPKVALVTALVGKTDHWTPIPTASSMSISSTKHNFYPFMQSWWFYSGICPHINQTRTWLNISQIYGNIHTTRSRESLPVGQGCIVVHS